MSLVLALHRSTFKSTDNGPWNYVYGVNGIWYLQIPNISIIMAWPYLRLVGLEIVSMGLRPTTPTFSRQKMSRDRQQIDLLQMNLNQSTSADDLLVYGVYTAPQILSRCLTVSFLVYSNDYLFQDLKRQQQNRVQSIRSYSSPDRGISTPRGRERSFLWSHTTYGSPRLSLR